MTYSLDTLITSGGASAAPRTGLSRFAHETAIVLGLVGMVFWLIALISYSPQDAAFSTSGTGGLTANWGGRLGALLADANYFLFGFSAWWPFAAAVRAWLTSLAQWMRGEGRADSQGHFSRTRIAFWLALALLLCASCALEWSRLYRFEGKLPDHAGGALGFIVGPLGVKWLGFTGSGLVFVALVVVGAAVVFRFSWSHVAERLGARLYGLVEARREKREIAEDVALGQQAARLREEVLQEERVEIEEHHPVPVLIEPLVLDVPKSERVAKERQKPLFMELPDSKLPQVDLLDGPTGRQETVSNETLEMTSRLIEKKLKDFGVEVRVVLAQPGPVITRYEIEPATGVKGSQIVNLAKDLARSLSLVSIRVIETIPGKNFMALELPNAKRQSIRLSEILGSQVYNEAKSM
ncbi:MAG: DNA translocase FtsK 4TM domain-containing protein, partial [Ramlibacter sp.]|nr:DNA translocase FtsK 4TM domain-containing protein [Ramlibacter sp.]